VRVQRAGSDVMVTVGYPRSRRREASVSLWVAAVVATLTSALAIWGSVCGPTLAKAVLLLAALIAVLGLLVAAIQRAHVRRTFVFVAGPDGLTVRTIGRFSRSSRSYSRERIKEVRVVGRTRRKNGRSALCIVPNRAWQRPDQWMVMLDEPLLEQVARPLREGLRL
jgi:hypothetical protein